MKRLLLGAALALTGAAVCAQTPEGEEGPFLGERLEALSYNTVGPSPQVVIPPGFYALSIDGDFELGGFVFKDGQPFLHDDGGSSAYNTALGRNALVSSTPGVPYDYSATSNTALGDSALRNNTTGYGNSASGARALYSNIYGSFNTATGARALYSKTAGAGNTATGAYALYSSTTASRNTAVGWSALKLSSTGARNTAIGARALLRNSTGSRNTALGYRSGDDNIFGSDNILIGSYGAIDESRTLRIGEGTGTGFFQQNRAFISGIRGAIGSFDQAVCTDASDQLGPCSISSARFKQDIEDMAEASEAVLRLRPVTFRFKEESAGESEQSVQFGLIAEEVAELYPGLVTYDPVGRPVTVRYDALTPLLLNELQKQRRLNATQEAELAELRARLARLEAVQGPELRQIRQIR